MRICPRCATGPGRASRRTRAIERNLLIFNAGSSSLKFEVFECSGAPRSRSGGAVRDIGRRSASLELDGARETLKPVADAGEAAAVVLERLAGDGGTLAAESLIASAHRVVHGGDRFSAPARVTASAFEALKAVSHLAPLHNPQSLAVMEAVGKRFSRTPIVAVFDTAFFHELPEAARCYALPPEWVEPHSIRRYGFHGIAHAHMSRELQAAGAFPRAVTLHLGQGCSAAALLDGRPIDTSMGLTPLEGLIMGTRCGDVDPGVLLFLGRQGYEGKALEEGLNRRAGLLGLSGASDDIRELLRLEAAGHDGARRALEAFCYRVRKYVGAYAAALGGLDAVAVGGGIGENAAAIRARIFADMRWLGLELDDAANAGCTDGKAGAIASPGSAVDVRVVPVDEEPLIAEAALGVLDASQREAGC